jgi:uncharacterized cupredoxin-like copper-binding protein
MPRHRVLSGLVLTALLTALAGCASTSTSTGSDTLEGGVKLPASAQTTNGPTTVKVRLGDSGGASGRMTLTVAPASAPAGDVTFVVKNAGSMVHEAVVLQTDVPFDKLPVTDAGDPPVPVASGGNKVSEDHNVGETGDPDLEPGGTRTFTIKHMVAGKYVIVCNLAGHYTAGMRAALTIG